MRADLAERYGVRLVSRGTWVLIRFGSPFSPKVVVCGYCLVTLFLAINETLKWLSSLPSLMQKTLVTSYILSRLDYCNCLLMGTPNSVIQPLQKIQNFDARLVLLAPSHHHSTLLLENCTGFPFQNVLNI